MSLDQALSLQMIERAIRRLSESPAPCEKRCSGLIDAAFILGFIEEAQYLELLEVAEKTAVARRKRLNDIANDQQVDLVLFQRGAA